MQPYIINGIQGNAAFIILFYIIHLTIKVVLKARTTQASGIFLFIMARTNSIQSSNINIGFFLKTGIWQAKRFHDLSVMQTSKHWQL